MRKLLLNKYSFACALIVIAILSVMYVSNLRSSIGIISGDMLKIEGPASIMGMGDGGLTSYDLKIGDCITPDYGMIMFGNAAFGRTSYNAGNVDLDGTVVFRNLGGAESGEIEFLWTESGGSTRFAIPASGAGNATYNPRSMMIAGPAPEDSDMVTVGYWRTNNSIFDNIDCDTAGTGADLGVQDDLEVEGTIYTDSISESTSGSGVTFAGGIIIPSGTTPAPDISGAVFLDTDESANGSIMMYGNGAWRKIMDLP